MMSRNQLLAAVAGCVLALASQACSEGATGNVTDPGSPWKDFGQPDPGGYPDPGPLLPDPGMSDSGDWNMLPHEMLSSAKWGWAIPGEAVTPTNCQTSPDPEIYGPSLKWMGFQHGGTTYTCNRCPGGADLLQGTWRAVFGENDDVDEPYDLDPTYREKWEVVGNTFRWTQEGKDPLPNGPNTYTVIEGWYFCGDQPEVPNKTDWFVITKMEPEGAFGWETGFVFTADILGEPTSFLLGWYDGVVTVNGPNWGGSAYYCRVGLDFYGKPCEDPFGS